VPLLDVYTNLDDVFEYGMDMVEFYISDPVIAAYDLLNVDLAPIQRLILRDMWFKNFTITVAGRGCGKTYLLAVNAVLHCLLYPGYRVGLLGPGFRQCFFYDMDYLPIFTDKGMFTTPREFYNGVSLGDGVQSLNTNNRIDNKWLNEDEEGLLIKTTRGFEIGGLYDHRVMVLNNCKLVWKKLIDITSKDYLVIKKGFKLFGNLDSLPDYALSSDWRTNGFIVPDKLTENMSYLFGLMVGDGCVSYTDRKYRINFTSEDEFLLNSFEVCMSSEFGLEESSKYDRSDSTSEIEVYNKNLCNFLIKCGFTTTNALDKKIPEVINKSSQQYVAAFLSGLMDTDGGVSVQRNGATVDFSTSSLRLAKEVQAWFLNFGILSSLVKDKEACKRKLNGRDKYSDCATSYKVRITSVLDMIKFRDLIGFKLERKKFMLDYYIDSINIDKVKNSHVLPGCEFLVKNLVYECSELFKYGDIYQNKFLGYFKNKFGKSKGFTIIKIKQLLEFAEKQGVLTEDYYELRKLVDLDLVFVKPKTFTIHKAKTVDIEVSKEHCYWAGGFINHNSKLIFAEVEKLYTMSPILREACEKKPTRGADTCFLRFKNPEGGMGSYIEALPIGVDGAKIRGSRFYLIEIDELAQMPPDVVDLVLRPMGVVPLNPMQRVREIEDLIRQGVPEDQITDDSLNKMIMTSSGYFKFNHMWRRMKSYWKIMKEEGLNTKFAVHQVPYRMMPRGFLDTGNIKEAKRTMSNLQFMMEYEAAMISDSEGFFKASLLEACSMNSDFTIQTRGTGGRNYVLGIDPNQGGSALFGIVVIELGNPNKVVIARGYKRQSTQQMTKIVQRLIEAFNITRIYMDAQGGGNAIKDLLEEGYGDSTPVLDMDDERTMYKAGKRILRLINFSPAWIADANFTALALLENQRLRFPSMPRTSSEEDERLYEDIKLLRYQLLSIIVTETSHGIRHFDTPKKGQNKDLYSAFILGCYGIKELTKETEIKTVNVVADGLMRQHAPGAKFGPIGVVPGNDYSPALLKKLN